mmetsp:Transcript_5062/g.13827  ORF Transcript_5062/g.13827 Transcript_5062/m.13827 type:complete len:240 (+) Transcript_5062:1226-1945(+)
MHLEHDVSCRPLALAHGHARLLWCDPPAATDRPASPEAAFHLATRLGTTQPGRWLFRCVAVVDDHVMDEVAAPLRRDQWVVGYHMVFAVVGQNHGQTHVRRVLGRDGHVRHLNVDGLDARCLLDGADLVVVSENECLGDPLGRPVIHQLVDLFSLPRGDHLHFSLADVKVFPYVARLYIPLNQKHGLLSSAVGEDQLHILLCVERGHRVVGGEHVLHHICAVAAFADHNDVSTLHAAVC